jgi:hypothetical protein
MSPQQEAMQAMTSNLVGAIPGPIGTAAGVAALGHDAINAIIAPALGDREEAARARSDVALNAIGLIPGVGDLIGGTQAAWDALQMGARHHAALTPEGDLTRPGAAEWTRQEFPLSGDLFDRGLSEAGRFARSVFTAPPILDERPYCE